MTDLQPPRIMGRVGRMPTNGNGRYDDGTRTWQRVSNLLKNIETDTHQLDEWKANTLAIGLSQRSDLVLGVAAAAEYDPGTGKLTAEAKSTLRGLRKQAMDAGKAKAGANTGTAVHTATERLDLGESVEQIALPAPYDADLRAYEALKVAMGLTFQPEHIERTVRNVTVDAAGTFDRLGASALLEERGILRPGELLVVDVKTESAPLFNLMHIAPQLATYAYADAMWNPGLNGYEALPEVSGDVGLVIHVRNGKAIPYLIDLHAGWDSAQRAHAQREAMAASKIRIGEPGCWAMPIDIELIAPAQLAADRGGQQCLQCRKPITPGREHTCDTGTVALPPPTPATTPTPELVAERRPDGSVVWVDPWAGLCPNCAPVLVGASVDRVDGTDLSTPCETCSNTQAPPSIPDGPRPLEAMLWEAIMAAGTVDELSRLYDMAAAQGVAWTGPIEQAGALRAAIVTCAQRDMHNDATTSKCACGWTRGVAA